MSNPKNSILSAGVAQSLIDQMVAAAQQQIKLNKFTQRNQPKYILYSQQKILNSNLHHLLQQPSACNTFLDFEPKRIPEDNLMNVGIYDGVVQQAKEEETSLKASSDRYIKRPSIKADVQPKTLRNKIKPTFLSKLQVLFHQPQEKEQHDSYVQALRKLKREEEQRIAKASKAVKRSKPYCNLGKGEQIVFDYQGSFGKRKQSPAKDFNQANLQGIPIKALKQSNSQKVQQNKVQIQVQSKLRDKSDFHKLKSSEEQQKQKAVKSLDKEELINTFQIKHPGVKIMFDGKAISPQKHNVLVNDEEAKPNPKTAMLKKVKQHLVDRFKTENVAENDSFMPNTKRQLNMLRNRVGTQVSESRNSTFGKISIQNQSLHNFVVKEDEERDSRYVEIPSNYVEIPSNYVEIPSKLKHQRRLKTNIEKSSRKTHQSSKFKRKERLTSLRKDEERLPRITNQHYLIQAEVFKQFRDKCRQY